MKRPKGGGFVALAQPLIDSLVVELAKLMRPKSAAAAPPKGANGKAPRMCSICRKPGHWSTTCPRLPVCSDCGGRGHRASRCPLEIATRPEASS